MESGVCSAFPLLNIPADVWTDKIGTDRNMFWITTSCVLHGRGRGHTLSLSLSLAHSLIHSLGFCRKHSSQADILKVCTSQQGAP